MKNIHILPTNNPSKFVKDNISYDYYFYFDVKLKSNLAYTAQNIYITSDEEIKEGDYVYRDSGIVFKMTQELLEYYESMKDKDTHKRYNVILTTDQDLIADGVQAIDDEFLEWFVKNPSCEEIETERLEDGQYFDYLEDNSVIEGIYENYKIIIPKEEPKQETLEEAAENYTEFWGLFNHKK